MRGGHLESRLCVGGFKPDNGVPTVTVDLPDDLEPQPALAILAFHEPTLAKLNGVVLVNMEGVGLENVFDNTLGQFV
jgi:hypothetical protein